MKPHRVRMAHALCLRYGLHNLLELYTPVPASPSAMAAFHDPAYLDFLTRVTPAGVKAASGGAAAAAAASAAPAHGVPLPPPSVTASEHTRYAVCDECPAFEGLATYSSIVAGGSIGGAVKLNHGLADVAINWAGGLHHAKKGEASGFCYVNDIVLAILELLKYHARVLYVDIDIHHGDGVEEAFLTSDRCARMNERKEERATFPSRRSNPRTPRLHARTPLRAAVRGTVACLLATTGQGPRPVAPGRRLSERKDAGSGRGCCFLSQPPPLLLSLPSLSRPLLSLLSLSPLL